jgi:hypothetical protein
MKKSIITLALICAAFILNAQTLKFEHLQEFKPKGKFQNYLAANGETYSVGDTLKIGTPSGANGSFLYISQMTLLGDIIEVEASSTNTNAIVKKIKAYGTKRTGYKAQFQTKGMTAIDNYFIAFEDALNSGELNSGFMSSDEALAELKKAKDKMDLGLISQEEFNELRAELAPLIK